jgi:hypothetical protein
MEKRWAGSAAGLGGLSSFPLSLFSSLASTFGFYGAIVASVVLFTIALDFLKLAYILLKILFSKRPDGTSLIDAAHYEIGQRKESMGGLVLGAALSILGFVVLYLAPKFVEGAGLRDLATANPQGVVGALVMGFGLAFLYGGVKNVIKRMVFRGASYEAPEVQKMKTEMMSAFKQGRTMDAINLFEMDVKSLTDQFSEANAMKFDFKREEKELAEIRSIFKKAETYVKKNAMKDADAEMNEAKKKYEGIRPKIVNKLRAYAKIKDAINELKKFSKGIEDAMKDCKKKALACSEEEEAYKKLDMNRVVLASESFWHDDNFKEALKELGALREEYAKIKGKLSEKIDRQNELLARKFPCLKCGKNLNLADDRCPTCNANPGETILTTMSDLVDILEKSAKKVEETKWLMNFESEESGLEEIQVALNNITKQVEKREFDRATSLLMSTKASQEALVSEMKEKLEIFDKVSGKVEDMKKKSVEIKTAIDSSKSSGIDVKEEESAFARASESGSQGMVEGLCKSGAFGDANSRLVNSLSEFDKISITLAKKLERFNSLNKLALDLEKSYKDALTLLEEAKKRKLDASIEERDLRAVNLDALKNKSKDLGKEAERDIREGISKTGRVRDSLSKKVEMLGQLEGMGAALEERMKELMELVSKGVALKLDVKEEHEKAYSIKMDRIREMLKKCDDIITLKKELDISLDTAQWCIASLSDKLSNVQDAPKWADAIFTAMKDRDMAELDALRGIPPRWRGWAVDRYIEAHPESAFAVFQNKLIRTMGSEKKKKYELILKDMLSSGKIVGCAVLDDRGVVLACIFPSMKNPMEIGGPTANLAEAGRALAKAAGIKGTLICAGGDDFKALISEVDRETFLLCAVKPKENIGFTSIVVFEGIKKLQETSRT